VDTLKVMIIDDDRDIVSVTQSFLQRCGFSVVAAHSGGDALAAIRANRPSVVLCDVMMPNMDGFWLCRVLKAETDLAHIPVIFVSARDDAAARAEARKSGGTAYLTKPFDLGDLERLIRDHAVKSDKAALIEQLDARLRLGQERTMLAKLSQHELQILLDRIDAARSS